MTAAAADRASRIPAAFPQCTPAPPLLAHMLCLLLQVAAPSDGFLWSSSSLTNILHGVCKELIIYFRRSPIFAVSHCVCVCATNVHPGCFHRIHSCSVAFHVSAAARTHALLGFWWNNPAVSWKLHSVHSRSVMVA